MNSTSSNYSCEMIPRSALRWYLYPYNVSMFVIYILVISVAVFANILVCIAVSVNPKLRQSTATYFIISLAVSDLATTFFSMPFDLESFTTFGRWYHNEFLCNVWTTAYLITIPTSMWNLFMLSIDRYRTLRNPWARFKETPFMTKKRAIITLTILWIFSTIYALAPQMGWKYVKSSLIIRCSSTKCIFNITPMYSILSSVFNFYVPMFAMCFIYYKIYQIARTQYIRPVPGLDLQSVGSTNSPVLGRKEMQHEVNHTSQGEDANRESKASEEGSCSFEVAVQVEENKNNKERFGEMMQNEQGLAQQKHLSDIVDIPYNKTIVTVDIQNASSPQTARKQERLAEDKIHEQHGNINEELICGHDIDNVTEGEEHEEGNTRHDDQESKNENKPAKVDMKEANCGTPKRENEQRKNEHNNNKAAIKENIVKEEHQNLMKSDTTEENEGKIDDKCSEKVVENKTGDIKSAEANVSSHESLTDERNVKVCSYDVTDLPKETQSCGTNDIHDKTDGSLSKLEIAAQSASNKGNDQKNAINGEIDFKDENVNDENECSDNTLISNEHRHLFLEDVSDDIPIPVVEDRPKSSTTPPSLEDDVTVDTAYTETHNPSHSETSDKRQHTTNTKTLNNQEKIQSTSLNSLESTTTYQSTLPYNIYRIDYLSASKETLMSKRKKIFVKNKKAACTVSIIVSTFLICWFPRTTLSIVQNLCMGRCFTTFQEKQILLYVTHVTLLLGYLSAAINPIVYSYRNTQFRRAYRDMARKLLPCLKSLVPRSGR